MKNHPADLGWKAWHGGATKLQELEQAANPHASPGLSITYVSYISAYRLNGIITHVLSPLILEET